MVGEKGMKKFFDNFIMLAIVLVLVQTVLEEIAVIYNFSAHAKEILIMTGFAFDLIFSIEFISRFIAARKENKLKRYISSELGWIDFASSIPLLILNSAPALYMLFAHDSVGMAAINVLSLLKMVKIIRVSRILRMLRFLKLLKNLKFINSKITQKFTNYVVATTISFVLLAIIVCSAVGLWNTGTFSENKKNNYLLLLKQTYNLSQSTAQDFEKALIPILKKDKDILYVYRDNKADSSKKEKLMESSYKNNIVVTELSNVEEIHWKTLTIYYFDKSSMQMESRFNLMVIVVIFFLIMGLLFLYSKKFALEISDSIKVVEKGFNDPDYFLKLKESEDAEDEIEELAKSYNEIWLPVKLRHSDEIYDNDESDKILEEAKDMNIEDFLNDTGL